MDLVFHVPINRVSFGQVSYNLLKEARKQGHRVLINPIGPVDLATVNPPEDMKKWIDEAITAGQTELDPGMKCIKLWHLAVQDEHIKYRGQYDKVCNDTSF